MYNLGIQVWHIFSDGINLKGEKATASGDTAPILQGVELIKSSPNLMIMVSTPMALKRVNQFFVKTGCSLISKII